MTKLEKKLQILKKERKIGLMTHLVIGYPTLDKTISIGKTMAENGADFMELQIPFSDPLADGPTIMRACEKSLENGTKVKDAFRIMKLLSSQVPIPLIFMAYFNTVFTYGVEKFCRDAKKAGADGLIVPDMAIEEENCEHFFLFCKKYRLHTIRVVSPASTEDRLKKNTTIANGFIYCTAHQGITGTRDHLDFHSTTYLKKIRKYFSIPIAVGFGISKKEHIKMLKSHADIAVIGSAIIDVINASREEKIEENIKKLLADYKKTV